MKFIFFILQIVLGVGGPVIETRASEKDSTYRYVITETGIFSSLDPLDADVTSNLPVARMIYATPLETSETNQLTSRVLESFRYDSATRTIEWIVKDGVTFEDGTALTADDVAFAVSRMAYTRPKFPVLSSIDGVGPWSKSKTALSSYPKGIKLDGKKISIRLSESVEHPLFRFCLELFSIIPRRCVDATTNKISCKTVPESGPYKIATKGADSITFVRRGNQANESLPPSIQFDYIPANKIAASSSKLDGRTVVAGSEADYSPAAMKDLAAILKIQFMPASRFEAILINKDVPPFGDKVCRQVFAERFRNTFQNLTKERTVEGSIFTKILPGYETLDAMQTAIKMSDRDAMKCKAKFARAEIPWAFVEADRESTFVKAVAETLKSLGTKSSNPKVMKTRKEFADAYSDAKIAFFNAGSGFWALDPAGDARMLFTPNLHKPLKQLTSDSKFQQLLANLDNGANSFKSANEYLFQESLFNVYGHQRRFFAVKNDSQVHLLNFAITSPAPWQVFKVH